MEKLTKKRDVNTLAFLFAVTYMISYMTRINYGAVEVAMENDLKVSAELLGLAVTGSFVTYGVGQIISGIIGDRISPKKLVSYGLWLTVAMNVLLPFCKSPYQMLAVWSVNGFAQSFMWPPLVRLMTALLTADDYKSVTAKVSWGGNFGTMAVYALAFVLVKISTWKSVFWVCAALGLGMIFIWNRFSYEIGIQKREKTDGKVNNDKKYSLLTPLMVFVMIAIVLQGFLRDGVSTWMPKFISDEYKLDEASAILPGVILPIFSILCIQLVTKIYIKKFTNPLACAALFFGVGVISAIGIYILSGVEIVSTIAFFAILSGSMHGVNLMLVCMVPQFFEKSGKVSTVSGVINSFTYIGSALSGYGIPLLAKTLSWNNTILSWVCIASVGLVICIVCAKPFGKRFK